MGQYHFHKHKFSDIFGIQMVKLGFLIKKTASKLNITDSFFESLSEVYKVPKDIDYQVIYHNQTKIETIKHKYTQTKHCLLQLHGGAYIYGFNDNYRRMAEKYLEIHPEFQVYSPLYPLAPKHPFPRALEEVFGLYKELLKTYDSDSIIFTGDSAGGGLALALAYEIYDNGLPLPNSIIAMSPWTDFLGTGLSYIENRERDVFFKVGDTTLNKGAYAGKYPYDHEKISPKYGDYNKLPDLLMFVGGNELIKSDAIDIALKHDSAVVHEFSKMFHVFPLGFNLMASSKKSWEIIKDYLDKQLDKETDNEKQKRQSRLV